ncbi:MAG: hypothetical protein GQ525_05715 [Draconibacterium sp.]|nr:hypothetical protein [Draconibacterium sp.]
MKYLNLKSSIKILAIALSFMVITSCNSNQHFPENSGKEITLRLEPGEGNPRNSEGDFIKLNNGKILFVYTYFTGGTGDNASAYLAGRYSSDDGKTWTEDDASILQNEGGMNIMSVSLLRLENNKIALFYLRKNSETDCIPFMRISTDEAKTWSEPIRCIDGNGYFVVNNDRFVQLQNDRIIFPASLHEAPNWANGKVMCYFSDDNGETWLKSEQVANPDNIVLQEPGIVELKDGKIMLFCRTDSGVQYFSFSDDNGETWSPIEPGNIKSPLSPASIERIPSSGDLILLWNNNFKPERDGGKRTPYNLAISKDEGKTWEKIKPVESDPAGWYCYTAIEFIDNHVLLGHCAGDTKTNNGLSTTQITRLSLEWIYKDATADPSVFLDSSGIVKLVCKDKNAQICYTLDGTLPNSETDNIYENPIAVTKLTTLFMQAFSPDKTFSHIVSAQIGTDIYQEAQQVTDNLGSGLLVKYYECEINTTDNIKKSQPVETGIIPQFSIEKSRRDSNFAFIFKGYIKIPKDGFYTFYLESNDGSVLYLNDNKIIDNDGSHGISEETASLSLKAGMHKIEAKYFQLGGGQLLKLAWKVPGFEKQEIPGLVLFHKEE